jgi:hypothetical protein
MFTALLHYDFFLQYVVLDRPIHKTRRAPDEHPKPDGFGCQIAPVGAGVKFNPTTFFHRSGFWLTRSEHDPLPSLLTSLKHLRSMVNSISSSRLF